MVNSSQIGVVTHINAIFLRQKMKPYEFNAEKRARNTSQTLQCTDDL